MNFSKSVRRIEGDLRGGGWRMAAIFFFHSLFLIPVSFHCFSLYLSLSLTVSSTLSCSSPYHFIVSLSLSLSISSSVSICISFCSRSPGAGARPAPSRLQLSRPPISLQFAPSFTPPPEKLFLYTSHNAPCSTTQTKTLCSLITLSI